MANQIDHSLGAGACVREVRMRVVGWAVALVASVLCPAAEATLEEMRVSDPRDYAWFIGDTFSRELQLEMTPGFTLDQSRLPEPDVLNHWLELIAVNVDDRGSRARVVLTYRITNAVQGGGAEQRTVPGWSLYTKLGERRVPSEVPEWSFTQLPVVPASATEFLSEADVRADAPPPRVPWSAHFVRVTMLGLAVAVLALYLFYGHYGAIWLARWRRPFTAAVRDLRNLGLGHRAAGGTSAAGAVEGEEHPMAPALARFHAAVNEAADRVVMRDDLEAFFAQHPRYDGERAAIERVFIASNRLFFSAPGAACEISGEELLDVCRRLSVLELSTP